MFCAMRTQSRKKGFLSRKFSRREALSTVGKIAITAVATGVVAGLGGYYAGTAAAKTVTKTETETTTVTKSVTVGASPTTITVTAPATTVTKTVTITAPPTTKKLTGELRSWGMVQSAKRVQEAMEWARSEFEKMYPGAKIVPKTFEYPVYRESLLTAVRAGNPPDVSTIDQIWQAEFSANGYVIPLDEYVESTPEISEDLFFKGAWESCIYDGRLYGIPFDVDVWEELYYNKDAFEEAGLDPEKPPETWDELLEYGKALTEEGKRWGLALISGKGEFTTCVLDSFIFTNGGDIVDLTSKPPKCVLNSPENIETFEFLKEVADTICPPGITNLDEFGAVRLFTSGKCAMILVGGWEQDTFKAQAPTMNWGVGYIPVPKKGMKPVGCFGGWNLVIYKDAKNKDLAWEWIKFLVRPDVNYKVASLTPAVKESGKKYLEEYRKGAEIYYNTLMWAKPRPLIPEYPKISDIQIEAWHKIVLGQASVREALNEATEKINKILSS